MPERVYNFSAGPATMPAEVLERAAREMTSYQGAGLGVMEMSHRSKAFIAIADSVERKLREAMRIPNNYKVLFLQGGATLQFSAVPMNLGVGGSYAVTGNFSKSAYSAAKLLGAASIAIDDGAYAEIPAQDALQIPEDASYFHFCHNNTVYGTRWPYIPSTGGVPLVCDMSSSILSEPMDIGRYGVIYAGAQKNMGPAGLTVVIVRDDLLEREPLPFTPSLLRWKKQAESDSMINTPATYGIYLLGLTLDWLREQGGTEAMCALNEQKSKLIYDVVDHSKHFTCPAQGASRSIMNVVFRTGDETLDDRFVKEAAKEGMITLKGHRATGGMRASMYNAMPLSGAQKLAEFIAAFDRSL